jgi:DNA-directed RNA polymerase specialized sigma24 family protein
MMDVATRLLEPILVMQAQLGNTTAFSQLVSGHHASLRYYVRRIVGGSNETEDVVQGG